MEHDVIAILSKVLSITGYKDDQEAFIAEFINFCTQKALKEYIEMLPQARRKALKKILHQKNSKKREEQLEPYTSTEEFGNLFEEQAEKLFGNYLKTIIHQLSEKQKNNLYKYFSSLEADQQTSLSL